jgi:Fe-S cluster assembly ATP-binding protein
MKPLLSITDLWVEVGGKSVLRGIDLSIPNGEVHILFGPNGSGKSTLLSAVMGLPGYRISQGSIAFRGKRIDGLAPNEIARLGIGLAFQHPPAIRGVALETSSGDRPVGRAAQRLQQPAPRQPSPPG